MRIACFLTTKRYDLLSEYNWINGNIMQQTVKMCRFLYLDVQWYSNIIYYFTARIYIRIILSISKIYIHRYSFSIRCCTNLFLIWRQINSFSKWEAMPTWGNKRYQKLRYLLQKLQLLFGWLSLFSIISGPFSRLRCILLYY